MSLSLWIMIYAVYPVRGVDISLTYVLSTVEMQWNMPAFRQWLVSTASLPNTV